MAGRRQDGGGSAATALLMKGAPSREVLVPRLVVMAIVALLLVVGIVMIYSASSVDAYVSDANQSSAFFRKHLIIVAASVVVAVLVVAFRNLWWNQRFLLWAWIISTVMLIVTFGFGFVGLGAKRWIDLGFFQLQPSEFAKITVMLMFANLLVRYRNGELANGFRSLTLWSAVYVLLPVAGIIIQPDLGTTLVLMMSVVAVLWFGEIKRSYLIAIFAAIAVLAIIAILAAGFRSDRIMAWLHPQDDPYGYGYQSLNSYYAFANGGFLGVGLGNSTQKYQYLTYPHNDFIYAIVGEEGGFVAAVGLIVLFLALAFFSFRIGRHAQSEFGMLICNSAAATIVFQALLNMGCVSGVFPVTGKPLPFISYGGSSLVSTMILVGIILSVSFWDSDDGSRRRRRTISERSRDGGSPTGTRGTGASGGRGGSSRTRVA